MIKNCDLKSSPFVKETYENVKLDFIALSFETKKKYLHVHEACEIILSKLTTYDTTSDLANELNDLLYPLVTGCETKDAATIRLCLKLMYHLIMLQIVDENGARYIVDTLWNLMESGLEDIKTLQTITLLLTTNTIARGKTLAKAMVLCFRVYFTRNNESYNIAGATVRQLVEQVFYRILLEENDNDLKMVEQNEEDSTPVMGLKPCASDAYFMFQDLILMINSQQPQWMSGMNAMSRSFGLELLEELLKKFPLIFQNKPPFRVLLKEQICALIIKLFSAYIKNRIDLSKNVTQTIDKISFSITTRLLRIIMVLIENYNDTVVTECEVYISLIIKFLDPDKLPWQRVLSLEIIHKIVSQPNLLKSICKSYDLNPEMTNTFQDMINSLATYIQSLFMHPQLKGSNKNDVSNQISTFDPKLKNQKGFFLHNIWFPLHETLKNGQVKTTYYLDLLDKYESPQIVQGYGISIAYASVLVVVRSLHAVIEMEASSDLDKKLFEQMIESSWCGLLTAFCTLLDATTDEQAFENLLKEMQSFISLCGSLHLEQPRDTFIATMCKTSLPSYYSLSILNTPKITSLNRIDYNVVMNNDAATSQFIAVGPPLTTPSLSSTVYHNPVLLTHKNLECMRVLLVLAHCHGNILGKSWHMILTTIEHLVWILGMKPSIDKNVVVKKNPSDISTIITNAVLVDLLILSDLLNRLFENTKNLNDEALNCMIEALKKLVNEAMVMGCSNKNPPLFPIVKLLDVALLNLFRIELIWQPVISQFIEICKHPCAFMRESGIESLTNLIKGALKYEFSTPLKDNEQLQLTLLNPLCDLSTFSCTDVRQKQFECIIQILHGFEDNLNFGWPVLLQMIDSVFEQNLFAGGNILRISFQSLQLILTDFISILPWKCFSKCVSLTRKFGIHNDEINISLSAIGLIWNISDYCYQNFTKMSSGKRHGLKDAKLIDVDPFWIGIFECLMDVCLDDRPAVRKSAGNTLFAIMTAHGGLLMPHTWEVVFRQVLLGLLHQVEHLSNAATDEQSVRQDEDILIHHTRNTFQKQWAETQVLTLTGTVRIFNTKRDLLATLNGFIEMCHSLMHFIKNFSLNKNDEVALASLKSFMEVLLPNSIKTKGETSLGVNIQNELGNIYWKTWLDIAEENTKLINKLDDDDLLPSQIYLTNLIQILYIIYENYFKNRFSEENTKSLCGVLSNLVQIPTRKSNWLTSDSSGFSLYENILTVMNSLIRDMKNEPLFLPYIFDTLITFCKISFNFFLNNQNEDRFLEPDTNKIDVLNNVIFGEKSLEIAVALYETNFDFHIIMKHEILERLIECLHVPLKFKYAWSSSFTWKFAVESLLKILRQSLPFIAENVAGFSSRLWTELDETLKDFLFPSNAPPQNQGLDELVTDEMIDCKVVAFLRHDLLKHSQNFPKTFIERLIILLNNGSMYATNNFHESDMELIREDFAKVCFETLLEYSLYHKIDPINQEGDCHKEFTGTLAVVALLQRFQHVVQRFTTDEIQNGKCPLPRFRVVEMSIVLKAIRILIGLIKQKTLKPITQVAWDQLFKLYAYLVTATATELKPVAESIREILLDYEEFLQPLNETDENTEGLKKVT